MPKCTKAKKERRLNEVIKLMSQGFERRDIVQYSAKNGWGIKTRGLDKYISQANDYLKKCAIVDREYEIGRAIKRLNKLYQKATDEKNPNYGEARRILNDLCDLFGLKEHISRIQQKNLIQNTEREPVSIHVVYDSPARVDDIEDVRQPN